MESFRCPFCTVAPEATFHRTHLVAGVWDAFPASPGHALLVPHRHVERWFDATAEERDELLRATEVAKRAIEDQYHPDGYNIGINVGTAAGQTIPHLHVHVIPRYHGDVPDPRGGVRHVISSKGNYLVDTESGTANSGAGGHARALTTGGERPFLPRLAEDLGRAQRADWAVAFVTAGGVRRVIEHLRDLLGRGGRLRLLTGDYLDVTDPKALRMLLDLEGNVELRVFEADQVSFHPKAYLLHYRDGSGAAYVGSSNLTATALERGIEWNYRVTPARDPAGFTEVAYEFDAFFTHPSARPLTYDWVEAYEARRTPPAARPGDNQLIQVSLEEDEEVPKPHPVQEEALDALEKTREGGNSAGLVVLATGLGKTWLSAFDTDRPEFQRVLFVAHRDEILTQAMRTFRRIRPRARLGKYTGTEKVPDADVLFASIQTLGRQRHLDNFDPKRFDYIVVDEFHHAAARTYRRLIGHFNPRFMLGLTATPERTDGGDLLSLCHENLVYRCDIPEAIERGLLSPFHYFGVPDEVDYTHIPWRSNRFDENALTNAVATQARAANVLDQYRRRAGRRTLAFCVSQRHADFMARYFEETGVRAAAVHSGPTSAPRAASLEALQRGELDVVASVDMFNEGVDLPDVDTVMMLRPTESRILFLQQLGRGLRRAPNKEKLTVIDYIGNHRSFLTKPRALFNLGPGDAEVRDVLQRLQSGELELPPGCDVTYELETIDLLTSMLRQPKAEETVRAYYEEFRERHGVRPRAVEAYHDGVNPRSLRAPYGSWLRFVQAMGDLDSEEQRVLAQAGGFLDALETTPMVKSYKMVTLEAMLEADAFPGEMHIDDLLEAVRKVVGRSSPLSRDVGEPLNDPPALRRHWEQNPIRAWSGGRGTPGGPYFEYDGEQFRTLFNVPDSSRAALRDLVDEIVEWRLADYLQRGNASPSEYAFVCKASHASGRPILFLPKRSMNPYLPRGPTPVLVDGKEHVAKFVKVAVNVMTRPGESQNILPEVLHGWFGESAGTPGTNHEVKFRKSGNRWVMEPVRRR